MKSFLDGQVLEVRAQQEQAAMGAAEAPPAGPRREEEVSSMLVAVCALPAPFASSRPFKWTKSADPILASAVLDPDGPTASLV